VFARTRLRREDESPFTAAGEASTRGRVYPGGVERPINTALGWPLPPWLLDYGPVVFILLEGTVAIALHRGAGGTPRFLLALALIVTVVALIWRHRAPVLALVFVLAVAVALDYGPIVMLPTLLAVFTVAEYRDRTTVIGVALVGFVALVAAQPIHGNPLSLPAVLSRLVAVGLAVAVGLYLRARADFISGLGERAARLEREHELLAQQAVGEERVRIARELHDVVAHNVSLMVVQAQALAATGSDDQQRSSLTQLAGLGREALSEMHRMLGVLRLDNAAEEAEREPQPGVRDLQRLIDRAGSAGISATLVVDGEPRPLPPGVDLSAYRIVQEALTNVIRHAHADSVTVMLNYRGSDLEVTVIDDGVGAVSNGDGGHGLVGMRERVALFGGDLSAGPIGSDGHGYRVHAALPVG
jgi:signal transduction histidine kinase